MSSPLSSVPALLDHLEPLSHAARWKEMIQIGRKCATPPDAVAAEQLVVALAKSTVHYERLLAAMAMRGAAAVSNPLPSTLADACHHLFLDPSSTIYRIVQEPLVRTSGDDTLRQLLKTCPIRQFRVLTKALARMGRDAVLHALFKEVGGPKKAASGFPAERVAVLSGYMPADALAGMQDEEETALPFAAVRTLTWRQPALMVDRLTAAVVAACGAETEAERPPMPKRLEEMLFAAFSVLVDAKNTGKDATAAALRLMESTLHLVKFRGYMEKKRIGDILSRLASRTLRPVMEYMLRHADVFTQLMDVILSERCYAILDRDPELLRRVFRAGVVQFRHSDLSSFFERLPAQTRRLFWQTDRIALFNRVGVISVEDVAALPDAAERAALAEQMFNHPSLEDSPSERLPYLGVLAFPKAKELAEPFASDPQPEVRLATVGPLVQSAAFHPMYLGTILGHFVQRRKERDPYRVALFNALVNVLPPSAWMKGGADEFRSHEEKVVQLVQAALEAKDVSRRSLEMAQRLLLTILHHDPQTLAPLFISVVKPFDCLCHFTGRRRVTADAARVAADALVPWARAAMAKKGPRDMTQVLVNAFGDAHVRRLWRTHFRDLADTCLADSDVDSIRYGLELYSTFDYGATYTPLVLSWLAKDPDAILLDTCKVVVAGMAQGPALTKALHPVDDEAFTGRVRTQCGFDNPIHHISFDTRRYSRMWTAKQQALYAKTLTNVLEEHYKEDYTEVGELLRAIAAIPSADFDTCLRPFASLDYDVERTRSIAITVMGKMKDKGSLQELLAALGDARVSDAAVAIQSRLRNWSSAEVVALLQPVMVASPSVTVQKQLCRFMGDYGDENAFQCLNAFRDAKAAAGDLHPDVRVALVAAYYPFLHREEVWAFYETVAQSSREADVNALAAIPVDLLRETWQLARMNGILLGMLTHSANRVQSVALEYLAKQPIRLEDDRIYKILLDNLSRVKEPTIQQQSLNSIFAFRTAPVEMAASAIAALKKDSVLQRCVNIISGAASQGGGPAFDARVRRTASLLAEHLIAARRQAALVVELVMVSPESTWPAQLLALDAQGLLYAKAQEAVLENVNNYLGRNQRSLENLEAATLRTHSNAHLRRLGLRILTHTGSSENWPEDQIEGLKRYREDPDATVRDEARLTQYREEDNDDDGEGEGDARRH